METVRILFLNGTQESHWMNRLVSYFDPPFCHVEIEFDMQTRSLPAPSYFSMFMHSEGQKPMHKTIASSIYAGETVFVKERKFANPHYSIVTLNVPTSDFFKMYNFCLSAQANKTEFNEWGMYTSFFTCCCKFPKKNATFCSEYITNVLKSGNVKCVQHVQSSKMSPSKLWKILQEHDKQMFSTVPYKMDLL